MKLKQYILALASSAFLLGLAGCKKQLEEVKPETTLDPSQVLADPSSAFALYNGVYNTFRGYQGTFFVMGEMRSETWANGLFTESGDGGLTQFWMHNFNEANAPYGNWGGFYGLLSRMNTVLKLFPAARLTEPQKNRYRGEIFGMRAYVYYTMLRTWGAVPLATEPLEKIGELSALYKHRTNADSIMLQIKSDIDSSLALIGPNVMYSTPSNPNNNKRVYWNRAATLTLQGDAYIWAATHMGGGNADLTVAKTALEEVKNNTALFALQNNFGDVFDPLKKNNNREIIFAINFEKDQAGLGSYGNFTVNTTQRASLIFDPPPGTPASIVSVYPYVAGASRVGMTADLITRLTTTVPSDLRMRSTFRTMHNNSAPYALRGIMLTKFLGRADPISSSQIYDSDFPIYRYADVLLLLAEAKAKLNEDPTEEINSIRRRAYGPDFVPVVNGSATENLDAILEEYMREFIGEGRYWWAMRRAGDSFVYARVSPGFLDPSMAYKMLLPISVSMLNSDPKLTQTPGYN